MPGLRDAADLVMPGPPVTFQRFTRRARGPRLAPGLWLVGDSIFPGQSVPAVALSGLRVAGEMLNDAQARQHARQVAQMEQRTA